MNAPSEACLRRPDIGPARVRDWTPQAVFTTGSTMRHVAVMSATGAIGLMAIFVVDLLSLLYISWLGDINVTAGVGFATTVFFLSTSVNIGMMIAVSAVVSRCHRGTRDGAGAPACGLRLPSGCARSGSSALP